MLYDYVMHQLISSDWVILLGNFVCITMIYMYVSMYVFAVGVANLMTFRTISLIFSDSLQAANYAGFQ